MKKQIKIDWLLVFLLLVLSNLFIIYGKSLNPNFEVSNSQLKINSDVANCYQIQTNGIEVLNKELEFFYSIDGGENFYQTAEFLSFDEVKNPYLLNIPTSYHWRAPLGNFPELKTLVFYFKNKNGKQESNKKYFSHLNNIESKLPIVSLIIPESNIIGIENGMMVMGTDSWNNEGFNVNWWDRNANFTRRGISSEKEGYLHYFVNDSLHFESDLKIKISGNATRGFPQKSMQLYTKDANEKFEYPFFGKEGLKKYQSLFLRNSGNDNTKTLFADLFMQKLAESSNAVSQSGKPVLVFLNGNYWGIYNLRERVDLYYLSKLEDCKESEITLLEDNGEKLKDGSKKEQEDFLNAIEKIEKNKMSVDDFKSVFEVENLFDYLFFETYFANTDWPNNNVKLYKKDEGKWKFILHDLDYGLAYLGNESYQINMFQKLENSESNIAFLFKFILKNFKEEFIARCEFLIEENLNDELVGEKFDYYNKLLSDEINMHINRWRQIENISDWEKFCNQNKLFLKNRKAIYLKQIIEL